MKTIPAYIVYQNGSFDITTKNGYVLAKSNSLVGAEKKAERLGYFIVSIFSK